MYIVQLINNETWYLKATTWTSAIERADKFNTVDDAQAALNKAKKFCKPKLFKLATIELV